ncbi:uncharacterized protein N7479_004213 [Penicillium vulpinum]|uniref:Uncharacterized protein n=1 Tax=Penicillium vulpinum TaxID=29845 RepID=A0A1V6SC36_9EURO|nr:uncharacterized protein N7479_004213 [Penicillium vulpinum]KAJ5964337.1 hypothetical protein N7479_004213 [Penicillium vulpinum]OQE11496.1 hypothetical protein PENVUL_c002G05506 [Penicillium vulpinum]
MDLVEGSYATPEASQLQLSIGGKRDCVDIVFMDWLCVDFRERVLDALASSRDSTFIKLKHSAKKNILDILDCISSLSVSEKEKVKETAEGLPDTPRSSLDTIPVDSPPEYLGIHGDSPPTELFQHLNDIGLRSLGLSLSTTSAEPGATGEWPILSPRVLIPTNEALLRSGDSGDCDRIHIAGRDEMQWWSLQGDFNDTPARMSPKTPSNMPLWPAGQSEDPTQMPTPAVLDFMDLDVLVEQQEMYSPTNHSNPKEGAVLPVSATQMGHNDMQLEEVREGLVAQLTRSPAPDQSVGSILDPQRWSTHSPVPNRTGGLIISPQGRGRLSPAPNSPAIFTQQPTPSVARAQSSAAWDSRVNRAVSHNILTLSPATVGGAQVIRAHPTPQMPGSESEGAEETAVAAAPCNKVAEEGTEAIAPYATEISSLVGLDCTPVHLPSASQVFAAFSHHLSESKRSVAQLLTCLFYAVGSPDALSQLRHALQFARETSVIPVVQSGLQNDLATTVQALDRLDSITALSHILRRYYLVRLSAHRTRLEQDHIATKLAGRGSKRMLKYDCSRLQLIQDSGKSGARSADRSDRRVSKARPKNRSKTQALTDLMQILYPGLTPPPVGESRKNNDCMYTRKLTQLRNRLSCARNWYTFEHTFPGAILALIPCAGRYSISIDQVEKLSSDTIRLFLTYLQEHRGAYLRSLSQALSKEVFDVLGGVDLSQKFVFETADIASLGEYLYDTEDLLQLCKAVV